MTIDEAMHRKIYQIRLPYFELSAYVDPRVTEARGAIKYTPILDPVNITRDIEGNIRHAKVIIDEEADNWEIKTSDGPEVNPSEEKPLSLFGRSTVHP